jgi:hypothetical protein
MEVHGERCKIVKVLPAGTVDVESPSGASYRVTGLGFPDRKNDKNTIGPVESAEIARQAAERAAFAATPVQVELAAKRAAAAVAQKAHYDRLAEQAKYHQPGTRKRAGQSCTAACGCK